MNASTAMAKPAEMSNWAASAAQARALGFEPARIFVAHPIQDRTDEEVRALADSAFESILQQVVRAGA